MTKNSKVKPPLGNTFRIKSYTQDGIKRPTLPTETWLEINDYLSPDDKSQLAQTCKGAYALEFKNTFFNDAIRKRREKVRELFHYVVKEGNQVAAEALIRADPTLLLEKGSMPQVSIHPQSPHQHSRRILKGTVFQCALKAFDTDMCYMIAKSFNLLPNGPEQLQNQTKQVFPQGIEDCFSKQKAYDFNKISVQILNLPQGSIQLEQELNLFRADFINTVISEEVFNLHHLINALKLQSYIEDNWVDYSKRTLFWKKVVGFTQRFVPIWVLQKFNEGFSSFDRPTSELKSCQTGLRRTFEAFNYLDTTHNRISLSILDEKPEYSLGYSFAYFSDDSNQVTLTVVTSKEPLKNLIAQLSYLIRCEQIKLVELCATKDEIDLHAIKLTSEEYQIEKHIHPYQHHFDRICQLAKARNKPLLREFLQKEDYAGPHRMAIYGEKCLSVDLVINDQTPLEILAKAGEHKAVKFLIEEFKADPCHAAKGYAQAKDFKHLEPLVSSNNYMCLLNALRGFVLIENVEQVQKIISKINNLAVKEYAVIYYAYAGNHQQVELLLKQGVCESFAAEGYARAKKHAFVAEKITLGACKGSALLGYALSGCAEYVDRFIEKGESIHAAKRDYEQAGYLESKAYLLYILSVTTNTENRKFMARAAKFKNAHTHKIPLAEIDSLLYHAHLINKIIEDKHCNYSDALEQYINEIHSAQTTLSL